MESKRRHRFRIRRIAGGIVAAVLLAMPTLAAGIGSAASTPTAASTSDIGGVWLNEEQDAAIEVFPCGEVVCGRIAWLQEPLDDSGNPRTDVNNPDPGRRDRPIVGLEILRDAAGPDKKGVWRGGTIYDPKNGKTYRCTLRLKDGRLHLRGYVGVSLFGRTTRWTRSTEQPVSSADGPSDR